MNSIASTENEKAGCRAFSNYISRINKISLSNYISRNQTLSYPDKIVIKPFRKVPPTLLISAQE